MTARNQAIFAASRQRIFAMTLLSLTGVAFGAFLFLVTPTGRWGGLFIAIPVAAAITTILNLWLASFGWQRGRVTYRCLLGGWSVSATDIENWKLHSPASGCISLEIITRSGKRCEVPDIAAIGIMDRKAFARDFSEMIAAAKRVASSPNG